MADLSIVGDKLFESWTTARDNFPAFLEAHQSTLGNLASSALSTIGNTAIGLLMLIIAFIVAGVFMAYGDLGRRASGKLLRRIVGPDRGPKLQKLAVATVRSVALGVLGVAAIQALLVGVGLAFADVPGAGIWAIVTLVVAVIQVPLLVITIPAIAYIWSGDGGTAMNVVWTVYLLLAGLADNVLKPMFLGRGVEAPMPVILIGALGGMASAGIIGLFAGAVLLTVFYEVFMAWVAEEHDEEEQPLTRGLTQTPAGRHSPTQRCPGSRLSRSPCWGCWTASSLECEACRFDRY